MNPSNQKTVSNDDQAPGFALMMAATVTTLVSLGYILWKEFASSKGDRFVERSAQKLSEHFQGVEPELRD